MEEKIFIKDYILPLDNLYKYISLILTSSKNSDVGKNKVIKKEIIGYTNFGYPIYSIQIGQGKNDVILMGGTHGCEIATVYFMLEFMVTLIKDNSIAQEIFENYTFHIIPVLNPEGYKISSSIVYQNFKNSTVNQLEEISKMYVRAYLQDDQNSIGHVTNNKLYKKIIPSSINFIDNINLRKSVADILHSCNLKDDLLLIWSSNGVGIDPNANSIHKFDILQKYRRTHKYGNLRYNDIPANRPSPIGFYGYEPLDNKCPETRAIFNYVTNLYHNNLNKKSDRKLISIFSYHSTGGELYSIPSKNAKESQILYHKELSNIYRSYTDYYIVEDKLKYGFMDYFRDYLEGVFSLTVELSKVSGNPLSCFTNIENFNKEIINNKKAIFKTLEKINNLNYNS